MKPSLSAVPNGPKSSLHLDYADYIVKHNNEKLRKFLIVGGINEVVFAACHQALTYMTSLNTHPVTITMASYGGEINAGLAIYDLIRETNKGTPVDIRVTGPCMSMATIVLQSARKRLATPHANFMLHQLRGSNEGDLGEQRDRHKHMEEVQDTLNNILSARTGMSVRAINKLIDRKDYFISAKEALKLNLIDKITE